MLRRKTAELRMRKLAGSGKANSEEVSAEKERFIGKHFLELLANF